MIRGEEEQSQLDQQMVFCLRPCANDGIRKTTERKTNNTVECNYMTGARQIERKQIEYNSLYAMWYD